MFQVLLPQPNIFNKGVFVPTVNCAVLKWRQIDQKVLRSGVKRPLFRRCNHLFGITVRRCVSDLILNIKKPRLSTNMAPKPRNVNMIGF